MGDVDGVGRVVSRIIRELEPKLIEFRRDLHQHPEASFAEHRTTAKICERLAKAGLTPVLLDGTGLYVDLGEPIPVHRSNGMGSPSGLESEVASASSLNQSLSGGERLAETNPPDTNPPVAKAPVTNPAVTNPPVAKAPVTNAQVRGIRADIDALPIPDTCGHPWQSINEGYAHGCGHDVHATAALGAALTLAELIKIGIEVPRTRIIFQPAEEVVPGGAKYVIKQGALTGVNEIVAVHCEPKLEVGTIGTRIGPITSATDEVTVTLTSSGGHTSRPHLTGDVVFALGEVITQVPGVLGRRLDPRSGVNLTWGMVAAGDAHNAIPAKGTVAGTLRCLDVRAWERAATVLDNAITQVVAPYAVDVSLHHVRGVPPVDNDARVTAALERAAALAVGAANVVHTEQSLGGEDFAWYLTKVPGSMARLGTRRPGARPSDLHQGALDIDEQAIGIAVQLFVEYALNRVP